MSQILPWGVYRSFSLITNGKWHMYVNAEFSQLLVCFAGFFLLLFEGGGNVSFLQIPFHTSDVEENYQEPSTDL